MYTHPVWGDTVEGKGPQRRPRKRVGRRLEEGAEAVGGGYCRLQMPLKLALGVRETVAERCWGTPVATPRVPLSAGTRWHNRCSTQATP